MSTTKSEIRRSQNPCPRELTIESYPYEEKPLYRMKSGSSLRLRISFKSSQPVISLGDDLLSKLPGS